jgi:predicted DNA-binding transcriptional regulator AlpA
MEELLTTEQMMKLFNCSKATLDRWEDAGIIPRRRVLKFGTDGKAKIIRWVKSEVMRTLSGLHPQSPSWPERQKGEEPSEPDHIDG